MGGGRQEASRGRTRSEEGNYFKYNSEDYIPVIADKYIRMDVGLGAVKITTTYSLDGGRVTDPGHKDQPGGKSY